MSEIAAVVCAGCARHLRVRAWLRGQLSAAETRIAQLEAELYQAQQVAMTWRRTAQVRARAIEELSR